jgi:enolase
MPDNLATLAELDQRIADIRENLRELVEQAAAFSGAADEERMSQRIGEQQEQLDRLTKERDELIKQKK